MADKREVLPVSDLAGDPTSRERQLLNELAVMPRASVFIARKINLGNFENIDFSMTVQVPLGIETDEEFEIFNRYATRAIGQGLDIVIPEVNAQTEKVKAQRRGNEVK